MSILPRPRAFDDIANLRDKEFWSVLATGADLCLKNAIRLDSAARCLYENGQHASAETLLAITLEESAKVLIMVDVARGEKGEGERKKQLKLCGDHLSKGLYSKSCDMKPDRFERLQEYIDVHRKDYYLDGPSDVDYIFRNDILEQRENAFYVDYVATESGCFWNDPLAGRSFGPYSPPSSLKIAKALAAAGMITAAGLESVFDTWRSIELEANTHYQDLMQYNRRTLEALDELQLLEGANQEDVDTIINEWQFPLNSLVLKRIVVDEQILRDERERHWTA